MPRAAAQAAVDGALRQRAWQAQRFPGEAAKALRGCGSPEWLVSEEPRRALLSAAQAVIRHAALPSPVTHGNADTPALAIHRAAAGL